MAVAGLWPAAPLVAREPGRLTLVPAAEMAELVANQDRITRLVGTARDELAVAPRIGKDSWGPILTNLETAAAQSRSLSERFEAVAVAEGLSISSAALCARMAGVSMAEEDRVAVALARQQVEAFTQALDRFRLEPAHGAVEALLAALDAESSTRGRGRGRGKAAELRQSLDLVRKRLAGALDIYSRRVLLPFADAVVKARGEATDPAEVDRICAPSATASSSSAPPAAGLAPADGIKARRKATSGALASALEAVAAATTPPAHLDGLPRYVRAEVRAPRKIRSVDPRYTGRAREACIEGTVILQAVITKAGTVRAVSVLRSLPGLTDAAVTAIRRWKFEPATLDGRPVDVYYNVAVNFRAPADCAGRVSRPEDPRQ